MWSTTMTVAYISKTLSLLWRQKFNSAGRIKWLAFPVRCSFIYNKPRTLQHHDIEHDKTTQSCFFTFLYVMEILFSLNWHWNPMSEKCLEKQIHYEHSPKSNFIKQITSIWNLNVTIWDEDNSQCTSIHATWHE